MKKINLPIYLLSLIPLGYILKGILPFDLTLVLYMALYVIAFFNITIKRTKFNFYKIDILFYLWTIILVLGVIYSPYVMMATFKTAKFMFLALSLIYFSRMFLKDKENMEQLIKYLLINSTLTGYLVLLDFFTSGTESVRYLAFGEIIPIPLAMLGATTSLIAIFMYYFKEIGFKTFAITLFPSISVMGIAASKGPVIGLLVALLLLFPLFIKKLNFKFGVMTAISVAVLSRIDIIQSGIEGLVSRFLITDKDLSTTIRLSIYDEAINNFKQNPIFGTGTYGSYPDYPHNFFLEIMSENGLLLFTIVFILMSMLLYQYVLLLKKRNVNYVETIIMSLILVSLGSLMFSFTYVDHKYLFLSVGMFIVYKKTMYNIDFETKKIIKKKPKRKFRLVLR